MPLLIITYAMAALPYDEICPMATLQHNGPTHQKLVPQRCFPGYGKYITPCYGTTAALPYDERGTIATLPPEYGPQPFQLHRPTNPKLIPVPRLAEGYGKYLITRARKRTKPRVKHKQVDYLEAKRDAANEKPIIIGCGNPMCKMDCNTLSRKSQELVRRLMFMTVLGCKDYSVLTNYLMRRQIVVKGPWTIQEEYRENKRRLMRSRKPINECRSGQVTCVWCRSLRSAFEYDHKWGPLDCPGYRRSLAFLLEQKQPRMAYRYWVQSSSSPGEVEVCSSKFREVYSITEKQLETCQKIVGGVFWKARKANWYRTCDLKSSNLEL